jgi:hypothetical protein
VCHSRQRYRHNIPQTTGRPVPFYLIAPRRVQHSVGAAFNIFSETAAKTKNRDLFDQIGEVIPTLPSHLAEAVDAVRNIGNFAAHPIKSTNTGEIVDVEPGEAEWNLEVLEGLFDFYFVQPAILKKKRDALNAKLAEAKKLRMK